MSGFLYKRRISHIKESLEIRELSCSVFRVIHILEHEQMNYEDKKQEISQYPNDHDPDTRQPENRKNSGSLTAGLSFAQPIGYQATELSPDLETLFRQLISVVPPPAGMPLLGHVLVAMAGAVEVFVTGLVQPRPEILTQTKQFVQMAQFARKALQPALNYSIPMRRMRGYQGWLYFLQAHATGEGSQHMRVAGAALVLALAEGRSMSNVLSGLLVASAKGALTPEQEQVLARKSAKVIAEASRQSETDFADVPVLVETFDDKLRSRFRSTLFNARDREHQAIADHRASSRAQMLDSASRLRENIEHGDSLSLFLTIAALANLPESMAHDLPLLRHAPSGWLMALDTDIGCLKISVNLFAPARANAQVTDGHALLDAGDIVIIPLPGFAASALEEYADQSYDLKTLGAVLGLEAPKKLRVLSKKSSGVAATAARFRNGLGPLAVEGGLSRYEAAMLLTNPLLTPTGKFYYARATREKMWNAATILYDTLGWGEPVVFQPGLAAGSRQVVTDATVVAWVEWLAEQLHSCRAGRRYTLESVVVHHNVHALVCASLSTLLLALRARKVLPISQSMLKGGGLTVPILDKRVGQFPGARPVPVCSFQRAVFDAWSRHQNKFLERVSKIDSVSSRNLLVKLHDSIKPWGAAFFEISQRGRIEPIGTERLHAWWPSHLGLARNFGRHFWQNRLREEGVRDTDIDAFVRHSVSGMDVASSVSHVINSDWARKTIAVIDRVVDALGIESIIGMQR